MQIFIDTERCTGCGICDSGCPIDIFRMDKETGKAYAAYPEQCWNCGACEWDCPENAIKIELSYSII